MKNKKFLGIVSTALALTLFATACGNQNTDGTGSDTSQGTGNQTSEDNGSEGTIDGSKYNDLGTYPILKEKATITLGIPESTTIDYNNNDLTTLLEETGNMDIEFVLYPLADSKQKLQLEINSNTELPDVLMGFGLDDISIENFGSKGVFLDLTDYFENSSVHIKNGIEELQNDGIDFMQYAKSSNGSIYSVHKYTSQIGNQFPNRVNINQEWLDAIGREMPTTTDELYEVLQLFKTEDPNGNGENDEIPMAGSPTAWRAKPHDFLLNAFIYNDSANRLLLEDGKITVAYNKDEWRDGLAYIHKLVSEDLLSPLSYTQDHDQFKQMTAGGEGSRVGAIAAGGIMFDEGDVRAAEYVGLPPLKGPNGTQYVVFNRPYPDAPSHITSYAEDPEAIFRLLDFMWSEEASMQVRYGTKGEGWLPAEEGDVGVVEDILGVPAKWREVLPWGAENDQHWNVEHANFRPSRISDAGVYDPENPTNENRLTLIAAEYSKYQPEDGLYVPKLIYTEEEMGEIGEILSTLKTYVDESIARFATGDLNIDSDWDNYVEELNKIGLERYLEVSQEAYNRLLGN